MIIAYSLKLSTYEINYWLLINYYFKIEIYSNGFLFVSLHEWIIDFLKVSEKLVTAQLDDRPANFRVGGWEQSGRNRFICIFYLSKWYTHAY